MEIIFSKYIGKRYLKRITIKEELLNIYMFLLNIFECYIDFKAKNKNLHLI